MMSECAMFAFGCVVGAWITHRPDRPRREKPTSSDEELLYRAETYLSLRWPASPDYDLVEDLWNRLRKETSCGSHRP